MIKFTGSSVWQRRINYEQMKRVKILITGLLICYSGLGQIVAPQSAEGYPPESIRVHLSETCLFPGAVLGFKIYCTNPFFPEVELSRIAFIELLDKQHTPVLRKKILLEHGSGEGELVLPAYIGTGIYTLLYYTNWQKNFGEASFHKQHIVIINPDQDLPMVSDGSDCPGIFALPKGEKQHTHPGLIVQTDKKQYGTREKVSIKVAFPMEEGMASGGNFSVSVCYSEPELTGERHFAKEQGYTQDQGFSLQTGKIDYLPDFKGIRMSGKLEDASGKAIAGKRIIISEPGPGTHLKSALSDKQGNFHFLLEPQNGIKDLVFTLPENDAILKLEESFWNGYRNPPEYHDLCLQESTLSYLEEKFSHSQIQNRFNLSGFSKRSPTVPNAADSSSFHSAYSHMIKMDDYILLDSLPEFFYELVPNIKFIQSKGKYTIRISDPESGATFKEKPGVFVDGVLYSDYSRIAHIPLNKIEKIAVLPQEYYYDKFSFGGIVDLHTKNSDFNTVQLLPDMSRVMLPLASRSEMKFDATDYSLPNELKRTPDFRHLICWEPDVRVDSSGESTLQFYTGDLTGDFTVKVSGLSNDGKLIRCETSIWVE